MDADEMFRIQNAVFILHQAPAEALMLARAGRSLQAAALGFVALPCTSVVR